MSLDNIHIGAMAAVEALKQCAAKGRRIAELEAALVSIRRRVDHKTDRSDYEVCIDMCPACLCDQPKPALDALLAQAKREALEEAAQFFAAVPIWTGWAAFSKLRRMAREVKG